MPTDTMTMTQLEPVTRIDEDAVNEAIAPLRLRVAALKEDCLYLDFTVPEGEIPQAEIEDLPRKLIEVLGKLPIQGITKISVG